MPPSEAWLSYHYLPVVLKMPLKFTIRKSKIDNAALKGDYKNNEILFFLLSFNFAKLPWDGKAAF